MRIAFLDAAPMDYDVETPYERPTGGTQSAVAYLSVELARLGHNVFLISGTTRPGVFRHVECLALHQHGDGEFLNTMDVVIVVTMQLGRLLRQVQRVTTRLLLWVHILSDQPAMLSLLDPEERGFWDGFVFVSHWQKEQFRRAYELPDEKCQVMPNAVSPAILAEPIAQPWFKINQPPVLVYSTTPFRGLVPMLDAFPLIQAAIPDVTLRVFSSMKVYQASGEDGQFAALYQRCADMPGVSYEGGLGQQALAAALSGAAALSYPSIFPETSCIVAMEAMAVGAMVLTTKTGAMMETTAGFGRGVAWTGDLARLSTDFAALAIHTLEETKREPDEAEAMRDRQIAFTRNHYTWPIRAAEWSIWLAQYLGMTVDAPTC